MAEQCELNHSRRYYEAEVFYTWVENDCDLSCFQGQKHIPHFSDSTGTGVKRQQYKDNLRPDSRRLCGSGWGIWVLQIAEWESFKLGVQWYHVALAAVLVGTGLTGAKNGSRYVSRL